METITTNNVLTNLLSGVINNNGPINNNGTLTNLGAIQNDCAGTVDGVVFSIQPVDVCDCTPPEVGNWVLSTSCTLPTGSTAAGDVIIQNNSVLTIPNGIVLTVPAGSNLSVTTGSGVLIQIGGSVIVISP